MEISARGRKETREWQNSKWLSAKVITKMQFHIRLPLPEVAGSLQHNVTSSSEVLSRSHKWQCNRVTSLATAALLIVFMHGGTLVLFAPVSFAMRLLIILILRLCSCSWLCPALHRQTDSICSSVIGFPSAVASVLLASCSFFYYYSVIQDPL